MSQHYLPRTYRDSFPRNVIALDTETSYDPDEIDQCHTLRIACATHITWRSNAPNERHHNQASMVTRSASIMWSWIAERTDPKRPLYVFAHNLGFDMRILAMQQNVEQRGWKITTFVDSAPPTYVTIDTGHGHVHLVDSYNHLPVPLATIARSLGIVLPDKDTAKLNELYVIRLCQQDVDILIQAIAALRQTILACGLGQFRKSIGAQSLASFQRRCPPRTLLVHDDSDVRELERLAYRGARAEPFHIGPVPERVWQLDITSCYPTVMLSHHYPAALAGSGDSMTLAMLRRTLTDHCVIADVTIDTHEPWAPTSQHHGTIYPIGEFQATLTTRELDYALQHNMIREIRDWAAYKARPLFVDWARHMLRVRKLAEQNDDSIMALYSKMLANSLYGKFGQRKRHWEIDDDVLRHPVHDYWLDVDPATDTVRECRVRANHVQVLNRGDYSRQAMPAISAHVTADARMRLWHLMACAGPASVYYVDTDSLVVDNNGLARLSDHIGSKPGQLRIQAKADDCRIYGRKDIEICGKLKKSGIPRSRVEVAWGKWEVTHFEPWRADSDQPHDSVAVTRRTMTRGMTTTASGILLESGRLHPHILVPPDRLIDWLDTYPHPIPPEVDDRIAAELTCYHDRLLLE